MTETASRDSIHTLGASGACGTVTTGNPSSGLGSAAWETRSRVGESVSFPAVGTGWVGAARGRCVSSVSISWIGGRDSVLVEPDRTLCDVNGGRGTIVLDKHVGVCFGLGAGQDAGVLIGRASAAGDVWISG